MNAGDLIQATVNDKVEFGLILSDNWTADQMQYIECLWSDGKIAWIEDYKIEVISESRRLSKV